MTRRNELLRLALPTLAVLAALVAWVIHAGYSEAQTTRFFVLCSPGLAFIPFLWLVLPDGIWRRPWVWLCFAAACACGIAAGLRLLPDMPHRRVETYFIGVLLEIWLPYSFVVYVERRRFLRSPEGQRRNHSEDVP
jgi:hypothetical protein